MKIYVVHDYWNEVIRVFDMKPTDDQLIEIFGVDSSHVGIWSDKELKEDRLAELNLYEVKLERLTELVQLKEGQK